MDQLKPMLLLMGTVILACSLATCGLLAVRSCHEPELPPWPPTWTPTVTTEPDEPMVPPTATDLAPVPVVVYTDTPTPTLTPRPTDTARPTVTPTATLRPRPTATMTAVPEMLPVTGGGGK